jgi:hypothetical protein
MTGVYKRLTSRFRNLRSAFNEAASLAIVFHMIEGTGILPKGIYDAILPETLFINFLSIPEKLLFAIDSH